MLRHAATRTPRHGDAVAGRGVRIAGVAVHLAHAAGGEHHRGGRQRLHALAVDVERIHAIAARRLDAPKVPRGDHVQRHPALAQLDIRVSGDLLEQRLVDRTTGGIGRVRDAAHGMAALAGQVQPERTGGIGRERYAALDKPFDRRSAALGDEARGLFVDQSGSGVLRVAHMGLDAVVTAEHADDSALRPRCGALFQSPLGEHDDAAALGKVQGDRQACQPGSDDHDGCRRRQRGRGSGHEGRRPKRSCARRQ